MGIRPCRMHCTSTATSGLLVAFGRLSQSGSAGPTEPDDPGPPRAGAGFAELGEPDVASPCSTGRAVRPDGGSRRLQRHRLLRCARRVSAALRRAPGEKWTEPSWCDAQPGLVPFRRRCIVHRSQVAQLRGDWRAATQEADRACQWLADPPDPALGMAHYQRAELHRIHRGMRRPRPPIAPPPTVVTTRTPDWRCCGSPRGAPGGCRRDPASPRRHVRGPRGDRRAGDTSEG